MPLFGFLSNTSLYRYKVNISVILVNNVYIKNEIKIMRYIIILFTILIRHVISWFEYIFYVDCWQCGGFRINKIYNTETFYGYALKLNMCTVINNVTGKLIRSHEKLLFNLN